MNDVLGLFLVPFVITLECQFQFKTFKNAERITGEGGAETFLARRKAVAKILHLSSMLQLLENTQRNPKFALQANNRLIRLKMYSCKVFLEIGKHIIVGWSKVRGIRRMVRRWDIKSLNFICYRASIHDCGRLSNFWQPFYKLHVPENYRD